MKKRLFASYANKHAISRRLMVRILYYLLGAQLRVEVPLNVASISPVFK